MFKYFSILLLSLSIINAQNPMINFDQNGFHVINNGTKTSIPSYFVDKQLRSMNQQQLSGFLKNGGYLSLKQMSDGQYKLDSKVRGLGGGHVTGQLFYWTTKGVGFLGVLAVSIATHGEAAEHIEQYRQIIDTAAEIAKSVGDNLPTP